MQTPHRNKDQLILHFPVSLNTQRNRKNNLTMSLMSLSHRQKKTKPIFKKKESVFSSFLFFIHSMENWTDKPLHGPHETVIQIYSDALRQEKFLMETYSRVPTGGRAVWSSARLKADLITNYSFNKDNYYWASWKVWEPCPPPPFFESATNTVFFRQSCMQTARRAHTRRYFITFNPHYCLWCIWGHLVAKFRTLMSFFSQLFFSACLSVRAHVWVYVCERDIRSKGDYSESHILWSIKGCRVSTEFPSPAYLFFFCCF